MKKSKRIGRKGFRDQSKQFDYSNNNKRKKYKTKHWQNFDKEFRCRHCKQMVILTSVMGTHHRNHCNHCLWSLHVDTRPGNRMSDCHGKMDPIGLTFQMQKPDKYGRPRHGDLMIIHHCRRCGDLNINRIAGDDNTDILLSIFKVSLLLDDAMKDQLRTHSIGLLDQDDEEEIEICLFGKQIQLQ